MVEWDDDLEAALRQQGMGKVPRIDEVRLLVESLELLSKRTVNPVVTGIRICATQPMGGQRA